jgi:formylglycine-generating enzyme required for sulfatase activity
MRSIPGGSFLMGSPEDEPNRFSNEGAQHLVKLEPFEMSVTTITQAQWAVVACLPRVNQALVQDPSRFRGPDRPVEGVNYHEALEFCARLSKYIGQDYTLPTEAQWEYACRAGTTKAYNFGPVGSDKITTRDANFDGEATANVASFSANAWGLHDMHGNVWEWCLDHWHHSYEGAPSDGRAWLSNEAQEPEVKRLLRGGSWFSSPVHCRSACRYYFHPADAVNLIGFRVCCLPKDLKPQPTTH